MKNLADIMARMALAAFLSLTVACGAGCESTAPPEEVAAEAGLSEKGSSQIWTESCSRCHVIRSPSTLSDAQWEAALLHMRVRTPLPPKDQKAVLELMKAGT